MMMASGGRMKACVVSTLFCVGLVGLFVAQNAVGGDDVGAVETNSSISAMAQQLAASTDAADGTRPSSGDLYVMTSRESAASDAEAKVLVGEVAAQPKAGAIKAEELGPRTIEVARADEAELAAK